MNKITRGVVIVFVLLFIGVLAQYFLNRNNDGTISYTLEKRKLKLLVADSKEEWEKGLMYYRDLGDIDGMIFIFPYKSHQRFWNKNTFMDLEVYWLDDDKVVGKDSLPSIEKSKDLIYIASPKPVNKVIELVR